MRRGASLACLACVALLALVSACTGPSAPSPTPTPSVGGKLVWWDIATPTGALAADRSMVAGFVRANPGVSVDVTVLSPDDAKAQFDTAAQAASGAPDVITVDASWIPDFASRGYLAHLDNTVAADTVGATGGVFPSIAPMQKYDGRLFAAARSADGLALLYNPALLRRAHVVVPATWDQLAAARLRLTADDVQTLYAPATAEGLLPFIYGEGGEIADPEAKTILISEPQAVAGLARRLELQATGVAVEDSSADSVDAMRAAFRQGRVAMILDVAAALPKLTGGSAFATQAEIGVAAMPAGTARASTTLTATAYAVYAGSANLQTAYRFVAYADTPQSQAGLAARLGLIPSSPLAFDQPEVKDDPVVSSFGPVVRAGTPLPQVPPQTLLLPPLADAFRKALSGQGSGKAALDEVATAYLRILNGYTIGPANP